MPNGFDVTQEDRVICDVEADQGRVQPDVGFCEYCAEEEGALGLVGGEVGLEAVEGGEERVDVGFVGRLGCGESGLVYPVVDRVVDPFVHGVDFTAEMSRVEAPAGSVRFVERGREEVVEFAVEHADDLGGFVVHDRFRLFVPEDGHRVSTSVVRVGFEVELFKCREAVQGVALHGPVQAREQPAFVREVEVAYYKLDDLFEAFESTDDIGPVSPGAAQVDVQSVPVRFGRERGGGGGGDEGAEDTVFAPEMAVRVGLSVDMGLDIRERYCQYFAWRSFGAEEFMR